MLFHILGHIQPDQRIFRAIQFLCQGSAQFRLAHTGRPGKQETCHRAVGISQTGQASSKHLSRLRHRLALSHHMGGQNLLQLQQPLPFIGAEPTHRNPGPGADRPCHMGGADHLGAVAFRRCGQAVHLIPQLGSLFIVPFPYRLLQSLFQCLSLASPSHIQHFQPCPCRPLIQ